MKMQLKVLLVVLCLVQHYEMTNIRHHMKKRVQFNLAKAGLQNLQKKRVVDVKTQIIKRSQQFLDKQAQDSAYADKVSAESPGGREQSTEPLLSTGSLYARVIQKGVEDDNMSTFSKMQYKLNDNMLYFLTTDDDIRGVQYGFNLLDVPIKSDRMLQGDCCTRIEPQVHHVEIELYSYKGYCFQVDMPTQRWLMCDDEAVPLQNFRDELARAVLMAWFRVNLPGRQPPTGISESTCTSIPFSWSGQQQNWPCKCAKKTSLLQSPVTLQQGSAQQLEDTYLNIDLGITYSIRYGIIIQEPEFYGQFGTFSQVLSNNTTTYNIDKFVFKIGKAEHPMISNMEMVSSNVVMEMHLHGRSNQGIQGVLAVQFTIGPANTFIESLNIKGWDYKKSFSALPGTDPKICLRGRTDITKFDLTTLLNGKKSTTRSYFNYKGSLTKPPCTEQVDWFVMKYPSTLSTSQLSALKTYGLETARINPDNIRNVQPLNKRPIYYQEAAECPELPTPKIEPPNLDYKYIHAQHTQIIHGMASQHVPIKELFTNISDADNKELITLSDDLKLHHLIPDEEGNPPIDAETQKILVKKFLANQGTLNEEEKEQLAKADTSALQQ